MALSRQALVVALLPLLDGTPLLLAQTTGRIQGTVLDSSAAPVPG